MARRYFIVRQPLWQFNVAHLWFATVIAAIVFWIVGSSPLTTELTAEELKARADLKAIEAALSKMRGGHGPYPALRAPSEPDAAEASARAAEELGETGAPRPVP